MTAIGLAEIVAGHRARVAADRRSFEAELEIARNSPSPRDFAGALGDDKISLIAEVKRRSPSRGDLAPHLEPGPLAKAYVAGGASAVSVLTDENFFGGSWADLHEARSACGVPVLRKDFTLSPLDVCDVRSKGADAVLLIAAVLEDGLLAELVALAAELGLVALVETHTEGEIDRALAAGATVVGINQRDLGDFTVDPERAARLASAVPAGCVRVAESGVRSPEDVRRAAAAGFDAVLVGEQLVTAADPEAEARRLVGG